MAKKIKFVYADLKIAPYTGVIETDISAATTIGLLADGMDIDGDLKTTDIKPYGFSGKIHGRTEVENVKITSTLIEINADSIARTGLFTKSGTAPNEQYDLANPNEEYMLIIEEKSVNANNERLQWRLYPCVFTGKLSLKYDDKEMRLPIEYTVYADENDPEGRPGVHTINLNRA